jgi:hypothetical protein
MPETKPDKVQYFTGLDLGQAQDFTALAVLEQSLVADKAVPRKMIRHYACRHLERFPLGTPYTDVCERLAKLFQEKPLSGSNLVLDQTGVGRPVVDMIRKAAIKAQLYAVSIVFGQATAYAGDGSYHVPKKDLVGTLQVLLQTQRLKLSSRIPDAKTLMKEMQNFRVKITAAANETFEAWRERDHDDLVLAVAIAAWRAERLPQVGPVKIVRELRSGLNLNTYRQGIPLSQGRRFGHLGLGGGFYGSGFGMR